MTDSGAEYTEVLYYTDGGFEEDAVGITHITIDWWKDLSGCHCYVVM